MEGKDKDLHSNMVRFIIRSKRGNINIISIYIPIWLDLLSNDLQAAGMNRLNLHSNMVRFIILPPAVCNAVACAFTFQYG